MRKYYPRGFKFIKIVRTDETLVKMFACFGDNWKLNSGCTRIEKAGYDPVDQSLYYDVHGYSGSVYIINEHYEDHLSVYTQGVFASLSEISEDNWPDVKIEEISLEEAIKIVNGNDSGK